MWHIRSLLPGVIHLVEPNDIHLFAKEKVYKLYRNMRIVKEKVYKLNRNRNTLEYRNEIYSNTTT